MVVVDLIVTFCFYVAAILGVVGISISNVALVAISLSVLGLICILFIVTSFVLDSWIFRIINMAVIVLPVILCVIIGAAQKRSPFGIAEYAFYGMLVAWICAVIMLGIVDCYDEPSTIFGTVLKKLLGAVFLFFAASGTMNSSNWQVIVAIIGFGIVAIILFVMAIVSEYSAMRVLLTSIIVTAVILAGVALYLVFAVGMTWWYLFAFVLGGAFLSCYIAATVISGEVDGVTERVCDIFEL